MGAVLGPLPRRWVLWPALLIGAVTFAQTIPVLGWSYLDWYTLSRVPFQALAITGPITAGCAAFVASRTRREDSPLGSPAALRAGGPTTRRHLMTIGSAWVTALALGALPSFAYGLVVADEGWPHLPTLAATVASFAAFGCAGYALGTVWAIRLAPVIAFASTAAIVLALSAVPPVYDNPVLILLPTREAIVGRVEQSLSTGPILAQFAFFALCAASAALVSSAWTRRSQLRAWLLPTLGIGAAVGVAAIMVANQLSVIHRTTDVAETCVAHAHVDICVARAQTSALDEVIAATDAAMTIVGGYPAEITSINERSLDQNRQALELGELQLPHELPPYDPATLWVTVPPTGSLSATVEANVLERLSGIEACGRDLVNATEWEPDAQNGVPTDGDDTAVALLQYLRMAQMGQVDSDADFHRWYQQNATGILTCRAPALPDAVKAALSG